MKVLISSLVLIFFSIQAHALTFQPEVEQAFLQAGGSQLALSHTKCFLHNYGNQDFEVKTANLSERCNNMADQPRRVNINSHDHVVIVDYTKKSSQRRLFIVDLDNPKPPYVETFYVSHGRYHASSSNTNKAINQNTVEEIDYYSNVYGSNASSSGFYITGHVYQGRWVGPQRDKFSLIIHGVNKDLNDNACDRAVVVHGNSYIKESGPNEGVSRMSSGCFMLDYAWVNQVLDKIRGGGGSHFPNEDRLGGLLFFTFGTTEATLPSNYYCTPESASSLRL